ncbi:CAAX prenyl protease 1 [Wickerhamomyces ciferrii]|uniref:CAAX prenyl protease n=1 Tax=Wickerhamomyces ciferrii (strain ATCC 14091 / BCRC 22168 / CBS 111 / JCM 3599 / NBRC 0793 / NRRL Y-1031 F-60-10) TaxID=1206466 RepID=K0KLH0_WICCF|nr:CAAX prenyl protease 1 [Wickerhamomyces ciferrii]CCH46105.1 CAAX prenyl protease 1 [Wickerhamomyces ciferrii]
MSLVQSFAAAIDQPSINWKNIILGFTTFQFLFETYLTYRQYKVLQKDSLPPTLQAEIDDKTFKQSQEYSRAKAKFSIFNQVFSYVQNVGFIVLDFLPKLWSLGGDLYSKSIKFLPAFAQSSVIVHSLYFLFLLQVISTVISLPISYYQTFVLEEKFGFNKSTRTLWITDAFKSILLTVLLGFPILAGFLKVIDYFGDSFVFYVWIFLMSVQVIAIAIYPTLIQPLFNKLTPLEEGELKESIENLASKNEFPLSKLYVIDGSKRSGHSNAYFYGLPWSKQIVIYDTLINTSTTDETTAVLAHEIGHWALSHTSKTLVIAQAHILFIFTLFSGFIHNKSLFESFEFFGQEPVIIGFLLFNDILQPLDNLLTFFMNLLSRKHEYEADEYAVKQGYAKELSKSLVNLNIKNLSSPDADWLYSSYHYSHPILAERLDAINKKALVYSSKEK